MMHALPSTRQSALAFTEGVRGGWLASDLAAWIDEHLVKPQRLKLGHTGPVRMVCEHGQEAIPLATRAAVGLASVPTHAQLPRLLAASRERVIKALRDAMSSGQLGARHGLQRALGARAAQRTGAVAGDASRKGCAQRPGAGVVCRRRSAKPRRLRARTGGVRGVPSRVLWRAVTPRLCRAPLRSHRVG